MHHIQKKPARNKKRRSANGWNAAIGAVAKLADKQGRGIDERIKFSVAALRLVKMDTTASCEGHLSYGEPFPWIDVGVYVLQQPDGKPIFDSLQLIKLRRRNLGEQAKLIAYLREFYGVHQTSGLQRLIVIPVGMYGGFQLRNQGAEIQQKLSVIARRTRLRLFQEEFAKFAAFLKQKPTTHMSR